MTTKPVCLSVRPSICLTKSIGLSNLIRLRSAKLCQADLS